MEVSLLNLQKLGGRGGRARRGRGEGFGHEARMIIIFNKYYIAQPEGVISQPTAVESHMQKPKA